MSFMTNYRRLISFLSCSLLTFFALGEEQTSEKIQAEQSNNESAIMLTEQQKSQCAQLCNETKSDESYKQQVHT